MKPSIYEFLSEEKVFITISMAPVLVLFIMVAGLPIIWAIYAGFYKISIYSPDWKWNGLGHYYDILTSYEYWDSTLKSFYFGFGSSIFQLIMGVGIAIILDKKLKGIIISRTLILTAYLLPTIVVGMVFKWMSIPQYGIFNGVLLDLGILNEPLSFFGDMRFAMISLIVANSWQYGIFVTIMVLARLQSIPPRYYEAAKMDGANSFQIFRDVQLPNLRGVILIVLFLRTVWMVSKFDIIYIITKGGPGKATYTLPIYMYELAFSQWDLGKATAIGVTLFLILLVMAGIFFIVFKPEREVRV